MKESLFKNKCSSILDTRVQNPFREKGLSMKVCRDER